MQLVESQYYNFYFAAPKGMDRYAIRSNYKKTDGDYWSVGADGVIDTSTALLEDYPFELIPVDVPTHIDGVEQKDYLSLDNAAVYDLSGRKVNPQGLKSGIYISRGKKILVR